MKTKKKYVGLDVHKDTTVIAVADAGRDGEVRLYGEISSDLGALEKVLRKLGGEGVTLHVVYEAGPTGFVVYRRLQRFARDACRCSLCPEPAERAPCSLDHGTDVLDGCTHCLEDCTNCCDDGTHRLDNGTRSPGW